MKIRNVVTLIALVAIAGIAAAKDDAIVVYGQGDIVILKGTTKRFIVHVCTKNVCEVRSLDNVDLKHKFSYFELQRAPLDGKK